jgi:Family of unknown function (DUF6335)
MAGDAALIMESEAYRGPDTARRAIMKTSSWVMGVAGLAALVLVARSVRRRRRETEEEEPYHVPSMTALAAEAARRGTLARSRVFDTPEIPGQDELLRVGDPDTDPLENAYGGEETPGGDAPTPDQTRVDDIGRAYGVSEVDTGALRTSAELLAGRDRRR